jgi:hypothetical protein
MFLIIFLNYLCCEYPGGIIALVGVVALFTTPPAFNIVGCSFCLSIPLRITFSIITARARSMFCVPVVIATIITTTTRVVIRPCVTPSNWPFVLGIVGITSRLIPLFPFNKPNYVWSSVVGRLLRITSTGTIPLSIRLFMSLTLIIMESLQQTVHSFYLM